MRPLVLIPMLFLCLMPAHAAIDDYPLVPQAPGQCLATSAYLIQQHFAATPGAPATLCFDTELACRLGSQVPRDDLDRWIDSLRLPYRPSLSALAARLQQARTPDGQAAFDLALVTNAIAARFWQSQRERQSRLSAIDAQLEQDRPVLIHLERPWRFAGHYVTLIGFEDQPAERVYRYVDTADADAGVKIVPAEQLAGSQFWYRGTGLPARWNGRYLAAWAR